MKKFLFQLEQREQPTADHPREVQDRTDNLGWRSRHLKRRRIRFQVNFIIKEESKQTFQYLTIVTSFKEKLSVIPENIKNRFRFCFSEMM